MGGLDTTLLVYHRSRSSNNKTEETKQSLCDKHRLFNQIFCASFRFLICPLHFLSPLRTSLSVTKAQFRELRNSFKDIKPNLTAPRPTVNTAIKWPQLQLNSEEILMKKMYFWQRKSMFMPNQNQAKLFINTLLVTIELGASCKPMTLETACCCDVKLS